MTREIKFRGKALSNGEWAFGNYCKITGDEFEQHKITSLTAWESCQEVDPETVGQFTGLHDATKWEQLTESEQAHWLSETYEKDGKTLHHTKEDWPGKEVYEGDIFSLNQNTDLWSTRCGVVESRRGSFINAYNWKNEEKFDYLMDAIKAGFEVTGNSTDNPDLLKEDK